MRLTAARHHYNQGMNSPVATFREPTASEKMFNRVFGFLVGLGLGFSHNYLLEVRGRKSGKLYSTPVDLLNWTANVTWSLRADAHNGCAMLRPREKSP